MLNSSKQDSLVWLDSDGSWNEFSVNVAWNSIHNRDSVVERNKVVWFTNCIPRHAFIMWLFMRKKLKTQDMLRS